MAVQITRAIADKLGFDIQKAVDDFAAAKDAHRFTVNVPAPTAHHLVEEIYYKGEGLEVVEEDPSSGEKVPQNTISALQSRLNAIEAKNVELEARSATLEAEVETLKAERSARSVV
jgi:uncharacterized small protein (DUF1192 family)